MLTLGYPSVIVGNAQKELLEIKTSPSIFRAKEVYAAGIQEAWQFFYELKRGWDITSQK